MTAPGAVDLERLEQALADRLMVEREALVIQRLSNNPHFDLAVAAGERSFVVRSGVGDPDPSLTVDRLAFERRVLEAVNAGGIPAHRPIALIGESEGVGVAGLVLERVEGRIVERAGDASDLSDGSRLDLLADHMVSTLVAIHELDPDTLGIGDVPRLGVEQHVGQLVDVLKQQRPIAELQEVGQRLLAASDAGVGAAMPRGPCLIHGDFHLGNLLVAEPSHFRDGNVVRAVVSWHTARIGHPLFDLGVLLAVNGGRSHQLLEDGPMVTGLSGFPSEQHLAERYAILSNRDLDDLPFFRVLALFERVVQNERRRGRLVTDASAGSIDRPHPVGLFSDSLARHMLDLADRSGITSLDGRRRRNARPRRAEGAGLRDIEGRTVRQQISASQILDAAARAFSRRGFAGTSLDDIADELGCSKGRIAYYFRTKSDMFFGIQRQALLWALESASPDVVDAESPAAERLYTMVWRRAMHTLVHADFMAFAHDDTDMTLADENGRRRSSATDEIHRMRLEVEAAFRKVICDGMAAGEFRVDDPDIATRAVLSAVDGTRMSTASARTGERHHDYRTIAASLARFAVGGLANRSAS